MDHHDNSLMCGEITVNQVPCFVYLYHEFIEIYRVVNPLTLTTPLQNQGKNAGQPRNEFSSSNEMNDKGTMMMEHWMKLNVANVLLFNQSETVSGSSDKSKILFSVKVQPEIADMDGRDDSEKNEVVETYDFRLSAQNRCEEPLWIQSMKKVLAWSHNMNQMVIPQEILIQIMQWMNAPELLLIMSRLSTHLNELSRLDLFWSHLYRHQWPRCLLKHDLNFYKDMLHVPCLSWKELFYYRYTRERHAVLLMTMYDRVEPSKTESTQDEEKILQDLKRYQILAEEATFIGRISDSIELPPQSGQNTVEMTSEFQFEKLFLAVLVIVVFEELLEAKFNVHLLRQYGINFRRLRLPSQHSEQEEQYILNVINYYIESCDGWLSKAEECYKLAKVNMPLDRWMSDMIDNCYVNLYPIVSRLPEKYQLRMLTIVHSFMDRILNHEKLTTLQLFLLGCVQEKRAKVSPPQQGLQLFDEAFSYYERASGSPGTNVYATVALVGLGSTMVEKLQVNVDLYRESHETDEHLRNEINNLFIQGQAILKRLKAILVGRCIAHLTLSRLHSIMYGVKLTEDGVDHERKARRYLTKSLSAPGALHPIVDVRSFESVKHLDWFQEVLVKWNEKMASQAPNPQSSQINSMLGQVKAQPTTTTTIN